MPRRKSVVLSIATGAAIALTTLATPVSAASKASLVLVNGRPGQAVTSA